MNRLWFSRPTSRRRRTTPFGGLAVGLVLAATRGLAQTAGAPPSTPTTASAPLPLPPLPGTVTSPPTSREAELEERLRRLEARYEAMERRHAEEVEALRRRIDSVDLGAVGAEAPMAPPRPATRDVSDEGGEGARDNPAEPADDRPRASVGGAAGDQPRRNTSREGGAGARDNPSDPSRSRRPSQSPLPTRVEFGPGFQISSDDDEFQLQFHNLTQIDYRQYARPDMDPVHSGFSIPRQRWYFTGRMTRKVEFYTTINRGFGQLDLFDAFLNFKYNDRLMLKVGRFKTPFTYEFYAISAPDFLVPERSLFSSNFAPNRELGLMAWGQVLDKRLDYAVGVFNGARLTFQDTNDAKDVIAYVNARPFGGVGDDSPWRALKYLNVGGSVDSGKQESAPLPAVLRTSAAATNAADVAYVAPPFLAFNRNVTETGLRTWWGLHAAYFRNHLSLIAEWQAGFQSYAVGTNEPTRLPVSAYYVSAGYFLTGETVDRRTQVEPIRPFNPVRGKFGLGAIELQGRYSALGLGADVFRAGLADPNLWTDRVATLDLGVNWYLNTYTKVVFEWEHALFGDPVYYAPGRWQGHSDLFWTRVQVYF